MNFITIKSSLCVRQSLGFRQRALKNRHFESILIKFSVLESLQPIFDSEGSLYDDPEVVIITYSQ